ncbi:prephenate dehydratase [Aquiluna sp. KACHI24]|uniref:prephenate dehydratase n=1 Tax=Aquiluna sp. KACHI24 TaxID=2968831 RepID=UPI002209F010|nr:prephenate dehydratase [Aquiluna sp. KACHI24]BDP99714.1 prephenate dehydratase [Aquiluna sp. KACHI24]
MSKAIRIAYLGPAGTFTEMAARQIPGAQTAAFLPTASVPEALDMVLSSAADRAVVPIENSIEGGVSATSDALAQMPGVQIYGEYLVPVQFHLMAKPGTLISQVRDVLTHPVAYAQCRNWLAKNLDQHSHIPASSTASAAKSLSGGFSADAVIAAEAAAELYGLEILVSDIGENKHAQTRFVELGLSGKPAPKTGSDKTSVIVELPDDRPGGLLEMLEQFAARGVNLSRIESRPVGDRFGRYRFNIDAQGHIEDEAIAEALMGLHRFSPSLIFLGSYPRADKSESKHEGNNTNSAYEQAKRWLDSLR